jgi:hypothetical protein
MAHAVHQTEDTSGSRHDVIPQDILDRSQRKLTKVHNIVIVALPLAAFNPRSLVMACHLERASDSQVLTFLKVVL